MGSMFRSEEMCRCQLFLQTEAAYACVAELGELGLVQFRDLNPDVSAFQRKFVNEVRRCDEMERKLRYLEKEIKRDAIPMFDTGENPDAPQPREMIDLEATFEKLENELREVNTNEEMLKKNYLELTELKHILRKTQAFFDEIQEPGAQVQPLGTADDQEALLGPPTVDEGGIKSAGMKLGAPTLDVRIDTGSGANRTRLFTRRRGCCASSAAVGHGHEINRPRNRRFSTGFSSEEEEDFYGKGEQSTDKIPLIQVKNGRDRPGILYPSRMSLDFVAGVILRERLPAFERLLWRACRGNVFLRQAEITEPMEDPSTGDEVHKCVFIIFFQGEQLKIRVKKICEGFRATLYPCPETPQERREMAIGVMTRIEDLKTVLSQTQDHRHRVLVAAAKNIRIWFTKVCKIKAIYHTLNLFNLDVTQKCLIAECWCPVVDLDKIHLALKRGTEESGSTVPSILNRMDSDEMPPTYNRSNKFTKGFQNIVDAYGVADYREINPALWTIVSFPFLFAVMFGDVGHGLLMFLAALFLVLREKQLAAKRITDEIFNIFFNGRYIILLMGIFSMYTGLIYNEIFARSINLFGSSWKVSVMYDTVKDMEYDDTLDLDPKWAYNNQSYPLGMDPIWNLAENKLEFFNSFKMKMSVVFGIMQMTFGVVLSFLNYRHFQTPLDTYTVFLPQIIFLSMIFVYLCILIFVKWTYFSVWPRWTSVRLYPGSNCAPSLLIGLIYMFMFKSRDYGFMDEESGDEADDCYLNAWYRGQKIVEGFFVVVAFACVPVMLLGKPLWLRQKHLKKEKAASTLVSVRADLNSDDAEVVHHDSKQLAGASQSGEHSGGAHGAAEEFDFGEVFIHQAIHTIEFCLGCISHTASYLRLWALSLAHAELSEVLWEMVLRTGLEITGYAGAFAVYAVFWGFGVLTVCVLVLMEGLSAFLHALRLHWVEFQSKFYSGGGYAFAPFSFDAILEQARSAETSEIS